MPGQFTNPEISLDALPQYETVSFNRISKKKQTKSVLLTSLFLLLFIIGGGFYFYFKPVELASEITVVVLILFFAFHYVDIILKQKYYGYALREKDILYRRGYIVNRVTVIPFNRIQHASISRSFLDKIFGIASLKIYTAGGSGSDISIPGLLPDLAKQLNQALSKKVSEDEY